MIDQIVGILGFLLAVLSAVLIWRKRLLNTGFEAFKETYRTEVKEFKVTITNDMADFKSAIRNEMADFRDTMRGYINQNEERHTKALNRVVELYTETHKEVTNQTGICRVIQAKREGTIKYEDEWKKQIEEELTEIKSDVKRIMEDKSNESTH